MKTMQEILQADNTQPIVINASDFEVLTEIKKNKIKIDVVDCSEFLQIYTNGRFDGFKEFEEFKKELLKKDRIIFTNFQSLKNKHKTQIALLNFIKIKKNIIVQSSNRLTSLEVLPEFHEILVQTKYKKEEKKKVDFFEIFEKIKKNEDIKNINDLDLEKFKQFYKIITYYKKIESLKDLENYVILIFYTLDFNSLNFNKKNILNILHPDFLDNPYYFTQFEEIARKNNADTKKILQNKKTKNEQKAKKEFIKFLYYDESLKIRQIQKLLLLASPASVVEAVKK